MRQHEDIAHAVRQILGLLRIAGLPGPPDDAADLSHVTIGLNVATPDAGRMTTQDWAFTEVTITPGIAFPFGRSGSGPWHDRDRHPQARLSWVSGA